MHRISKIAYGLIAMALMLSMFTGCNKSDSDSIKPEESSVIEDSIQDTEKTAEISGDYRVDSLINIEFFGAEPNISVSVTKVADSTFSQYIDYCRVKDKSSSGYKANDTVEIEFKFINEVDISDLRLQDCDVNADKNICIYRTTVNNNNGTYAIGSDIVEASSKLNIVCDDYAENIASSLVGSTWGSNKEIQKVKSYKLVNSYCAINSNANADDSVNLGTGSSRVTKAVNAVMKEYAYDLVYTDGTERTVCTILILPNIYKTQSGDYKLLKSTDVYNIGTFSTGEADDVLSQFKSLSISEANSISTQVQPPEQNEPIANEDTNDTVEKEPETSIEN